MLFDTHAHYDDEAFAEDRDSLLLSMPSQNIGYIVNPSCTLESCFTAIQLAEKYPFLYAAVGIHPENCEGFDDSYLETLSKLAAHPKVVAIGEIGLDYYWEQNPPKDFQREVVRKQMALAQSLQLPVIIHDRDAHQDTMEIVKSFPEVHGVFHCYSGALEDAKTLVSMGWMLSFNGAITFKNARKAPEVLSWLPLDKIMLETDSPYLTPVPYRGKRNDSSYVHLVAEKIAEIKNISLQEVESVTYENACRFFNI